MGVGVGMGWLEPGHLDSRFPEPSVSCTLLSLGLCVSPPEAQLSSAGLRNGSDLGDSGEIRGREQSAGSDVSLHLGMHGWLQSPLVTDIAFHQHRIRLSVRRLTALLPTRRSLFNCG